MIGELPKALTINGRAYDIDPDYRNILVIIQAFDDEDLTIQDKAYVLLARLFKNFKEIPANSYGEAYTEAMKFVSCERRDLKEQKKKPRLIDWTKDEMLVFPAINKVAGFEVRSVEYMHWWTFMGFFQGISSEDTFGFVLSIRQKRARHKKLEKYEQEFFNRNRELCDLNFKTRQETEDALEKLFREAIQEQ